MVLVDVNVLVYAYRTDSPQHSAFRTWLERLIDAPEPYGMAGVVLAGFVRVVTHPRIFRFPTRLEDAMEFADLVGGQPNCVAMTASARHWAIFSDLCRRSGAKGNLVWDAYLAALAIESGSEWITTDRDYSRFPGLRWRHPLE
jgi:hypothetical protein